MATMEAAPQADRLGAEVGDILAGWLADVGRHVPRRRRPRRASSTAHRGTLARFGDLRIEAPHVVMATGAKPNLDVARAAGTRRRGRASTSTGRCATVLDGVLAIGDIAHALHPVAGRRLRVEHWGDAEAMGEVAGTVAAGGAGRVARRARLLVADRRPRRAQVRGLGRRLTTSCVVQPLGRRRLHRLVRPRRGDVRRADVSATTRTTRPPPG